MDNPIYAEDDDGYYGYVQTSHDPGNSLIFATVLFCIMSYCSLPFLVKAGNALDVKQRKRRRRKKSTPQQQQCDSDRKKRHGKQRTNQVPQMTSLEDRNGKIHLPNPALHDELELQEEVVPKDAGYRHDKDDNNNDEDSSEGDDDGIMMTHPMDDHSLVLVDDDRSFVSAKSFVSMHSIASFHSHRTRRRRNRNKRQMEKRHELEEYELRMQWYGGREGGGGVIKKGMAAAAKTPPSSDCGGGDNNRSIMGPMDQDAVSMDDAVTLATSPKRRHQHHGFVPATRQKNIVARNTYPDKSSTGNNYIDSHSDEDSSFWDTLLDLVVWDFESKRIIKLAIPFATQAFSTGILEMVTVAVIGRVLGTKEVSAFVVVRTLVDVTSKFFGGFHESIATLAAQALGRGNRKLVGQYVQLSMVLYVICYLPFVVLWWIYMSDLILWLGFDQDTAMIGQEYTRIYLFLELLDGVDESIHGLLDVIDLESYSTLIGVSHEFVTFLDILLVTIMAKPSLMVVGMIEVFVSLIFIGINVGTIAWRGWFNPYKEGLIGSWAFYNKPALKAMLNTAGCLSFGYLLTDGEWEILTLFASFLGPAEGKSYWCRVVTYVLCVTRDLIAVDFIIYSILPIVAAWGILGVLWDAVEKLTEAVADASEVRCAFLVGSGQLDKAKRSAMKSLLFGVFLSFFLTSVVFIVGEDLACFFTNDPALQHIIADLLPLFGIGNMTLTMGTICWTLLGSQGRYRLSTMIACAASWLVTLPLAALFSFKLNINLQGQTSAIVIGYMVSGTVQAYFLFRSDWEELSQKVMKTSDHEDVLAALEDGEICMKTTDNYPGILSMPTHGTLNTLVEANSFSSSCLGVESPASMLEKELV